MSTGRLDLHDIQGNIVKAYPVHGFSKARYVFFRVLEAGAGRRFVAGLIPLVTTSAPWVTGVAQGHKPPAVTTNVAFSYDGLWRLGVPLASLQTFPEEFASGMRARWEILGDDGKSAVEHWDPIWRGRDQVHIFVSMSAPELSLITERYQAILELVNKSEGGVEVIAGHRGDAGEDDLMYQDAAALEVNGELSAKEHFGYTDGISNPYFKGAETHEANVIGGGKVTGKDITKKEGWEPIETGEFLLGHKDEAFEWPEAPLPRPLANNGTYLVYRKLHENVGSFDRFLAAMGDEYPGGPEELAAKLAGRWRNGAPITNFRTEQDANRFAADWAKAKNAIATASSAQEKAEAKRRFSALNVRFVAFDYRKDPAGGGCPFGAHTRRAHPRSALEYGVTDAFACPDALSNRRRLLRRGLPYGRSDAVREDDGNHGIIFMALGASIRRQFEFVQQQWLNYANDFRLGNEKDPLVGNHGEEDGRGTGRFVVEREESDSRPPFFCGRLPRFVETRGGDYFFVPSMTALGMIADGSVDPT